MGAMVAKAQALVVTPHNCSPSLSLLLSCEEVSYGISELEKRRRTAQESKVLQAKLDFGASETTEGMTGHIGGVNCALNFISCLTDVNKSVQEGMTMVCL